MREKGKGGGRKHLRRVDACVVLCLYANRLVSAALSRAAKSSHPEDIAVKEREGGRKGEIY